MNTNTSLAALVLSISVISCSKFTSQEKPVVEKNTPDKIVEKEIDKETRTEITKDVLVERLAEKKVDTVIYKVPGESVGLPNPLTLIIRLPEGTAQSKFELNQEQMGFSQLVAKLKSIFKAREENGVFRIGTNEIVKDVLLDASDIRGLSNRRISVEDFEKLVDDLRNDGIAQIKLALEGKPGDKIYDPAAVGDPIALNAPSEK